MLAPASAKQPACQPCVVPPVGHIGAVWEDDASSDGEDTPWTLRDLSSVGGFTLTVNGTAEEADEVGDDELAAQGVYLSDTSSESQADANAEVSVVAPFVSENMFVKQSPGQGSSTDPVKEEPAAQNPVVPVVAAEAAASETAGESRVAPVVVAAAYVHEPVAVPVAPVAPVAPVVSNAETSAASVAEPDDFSAWLVIFEGTSRGVYPFNRALYDAVKHDRVRHAVHNSKVQAELTHL